MPLDNFWKTSNYLRKQHPCKWQLHNWLIATLLLCTLQHKAKDSVADVQPFEIGFWIWVVVSDNSWSTKKFQRQKNFSKPLSHKEMDLGTLPWLSNTWWLSCTATPNHGLTTSDSGQEKALFPPVSFSALQIFYEAAVSTKGKQRVKQFGQ